ncbi:hypothetical protein ACVWXU_005077 [Streptomyces sp. TE33382]
MAAAWRSSSSGQSYVVGRPAISSSYSCTRGATPARAAQSPGPETITCSIDGRWGSSGTRSGSSEPLTITALSSAWLTIQTSCSAGSRRLRVWSTAPMEGMARYASTCSALFHMRVPTLWSPSIPSSSRSALASCVARAPTSAKVRRCGSGSPVQVVTCDFPWMVIPWVRMRVTVSGTSCMVLSTASSRWALRGSKVPLILLTYHSVCHYFREYESVSADGIGRFGPPAPRRIHAGSADRAG